MVLGGLDSPPELDVLAAVKFVPENILLGGDSDLEVFGVRYLARGEIEKFSDGS